MFSNIDLAQVFPASKERNEEEGVILKPQWEFEVDEETNTATCPLPIDHIGELCKNYTGNWVFIVHDPDNDEHPVDISDLIDYSNPRGIKLPGTRAAVDRTWHSFASKEDNSITRKFKNSVFRAQHVAIAILEYGEILDFYPSIKIYTASGHLPFEMQGRVAGLFFVFQQYPSKSKLYVGNEDLMSNPVHYSEKDNPSFPTPVTKKETVDTLIHLLSEFPIDR